MAASTPRMRNSTGTLEYASTYEEITSGDKAPIKFPILAADPTNPEDGDLWLYWSGAALYLRSYRSGIVYGVQLT